MCSSILSTVMGVVIIMLFSIFITNAGDVSPCSGYNCKERKKQEEFRLDISVIILVLGVIEFVIGVWAAICCCLLRPCACCRLVPRVIHHPNAEVSYQSGTPHPASTPSPFLPYREQKRHLANIHFNIPNERLEDPSTFHKVANLIRHF